MVWCSEISVLGPIEVVGPSGRTPVGGPRVRGFLGLLVLEIGHAVPVDRLVEVVWNGDATTSAVQTAATRVRGLVGADRLLSEDHSYLLAIDPTLVDARRFEDAVLRAEEELRSDPESAVGRSERALEMWRGVPYGDLADSDPYRLESIRLTDLHQAARATRAAGALARGWYERAVAEARQLVADVPYRDTAWELLVESLWRSGRRAEALETVDRCAAEMGRARLPLPSSLASYAEKRRPAV